VTSWTYQPSTGLLTRKEYADGEGTDYAYDSANRLSQRTWARGIVTKYAYTSASQLDTVRYFESDGTTPDPQTADLDYDYDRLGRLSAVDDVTGTHTFAYDPVTLQLTAETLPSGFYGDLVLTRDYQDGSETHGRSGRYEGFALGTPADTDLHQAVQYGFDAVGRLQSVSDGTDTFTYARAVDSNLIDTVTGSYHTVVHSYEQNRDVLTNLANTETVGTPSLVSNYAYRTDAIGRRTDRVDTGSAHATNELSIWTYNDRSEVIEQSRHLGTDPASPGASIPAEDFAYAYDQIGNRLDSRDGTSVPRAYTANELNQYTAITSPSVNITHDVDGNLTFDGTWTLTWNGENRLIAATNGNVTIESAYDYQGRLVSRDEGASSEVYVYNGWNRIAKFVSGSQVSPYLWGLDLSGTFQGAGGVGGLLKEDDLYPLYDINGNIMQKIDSSGNTDCEVNYDPFGNIIGSLSGEYGFSTKPMDADTGYLYYGFRWYNSILGRWPNRDPISELGSQTVFYYEKFGSIDWQINANIAFYTALSYNAEAAISRAKTMNDE